MSIIDISKKIKPYWETKVRPIISTIKLNLDIKEDIFITLTIIFIGLAGFGLGKLSALEKSRGEVTLTPANFTAQTNLETKTVNNIVPPPNVPLSAAVMIATEKAEGFLVASKSGKKYHFPWCSGASQISEKNKIWFSSYEEAKKAGYTAASNCKGLE